MNAVHDLAQVDLNLLVAFDVLARERSVTRAAERLGLTQSALSHALRRLRELLGDPLLVRGQSGMVLTPRAEALVVPLRSGLLTLGRALHAQSAFDAQSARRTFTLATPDLFDVLVLPPLLARVRTEAPGVSLNVVSHGPGLAQRLETGDVDFAVIPRVEQTRNAPPPPPPQGLLQTTLFRDGYACLVRADHPALKKRTFTLEHYLALSHALVAPRGEGLGQVDEALAERGKTRHIALRVPHFLGALAIVARSDLILTAPTVLAAVGGSGVAPLPSPLPLPRHSVNLLWHERFDNDPGHQWLRDRIGGVSRELENKLEPLRRKK
ncbi:MAG: LysR family transcriptional regulator [Polyangiales bacterium]